MTSNCHFFLQEQHQHGEGGRQTNKPKPLVASARRLKMMYRVPIVLHPTSGHDFIFGFVCLHTPWGANTSGDDF